MELSEMRRHGACAELKVAADIADKGYIPYRPMVENTKSDMVIDINDRTLRVQVKSGYSDGDKINVDLRRPSAANPFYEKNDFDILAIYDGTTGQVAYLNWRDVPNKRGMVLRFTPETNNNGFVAKHGRKFFADYMDIEKAAPQEKVSECKTISLLSRLRQSCLQQQENENRESS